MSRLGLGGDMSGGPQAVVLELSEAERAELRRRRGVGQALAQRIRIVLACAEPGATNLGVAEALGVSRQTVATWRGRFAEHRLEELVDAPCSRAPRTIGDEAVERLVALTLEERLGTPPIGARAPWRSGPA
jgi:Homeodomain-like domain